ncbi:MAG TPA: histidine phosphatase family protein [Caldilineae bacterium]|nr:histidine phosphatase family protein [Caldilineae bacterium]
MTQSTNQPTTLLLVRHGETDANVSGVWQGSTNSALNARGQVQARAIAARLAANNPPLVAIYSSPLDRAAQTAKIIAQAVGNPPLEFTPALAEFDLGEWEGLTYEQLRHEKRLWEKMNVDPNFAPPGGESAVEFAMRLVRSFQAIAARHQGQTVLIVSHGGAISTALAMIIDQDGTRWTSYQMANCALSELAFDPAPRLVRLNDIEHIDGIGALGEW